MNAREALAAVPRELFVPDEIFIPGETGWLIPLRRSEDPDRWRQYVQADDAVVTRTRFDPAIPVDLRDAATGRGVEATSSTSAPFIMERLINALDLQHGMRVLEIGTGTGYNAAVLAHLLGAENTTTIEIDPTAAAHARAALEQAGYPVQVITGDGENGYPPNAPYDRIIATASAHTVPSDWIQQTRPGGMILLPWAPTFHPDWPLCRLTVAAAGTAQGRFIGPSPFMPMRDQSTSPKAMQAAEQRWIEAGKPDCTRYGITVTPQSQTIWLDSPDNPISP